MNGKTELLKIAANAIGVVPDYLNKLITAESNWNPLAKNPTSSARGLIQWIDSRAKEIGYESSYDLVLQNPTIEQQLLGPVIDDLKRYGPFPTEQSLYMAVFYPAAIAWPPDKQFPEYVQNANIIAGKKIKSPRDYVDFVNNKILKKKLIDITMLAGIAAGILFVTIFRKE